MINITINGKRMKARTGETVLKIAERSGIKIPTLCYHKDLTPFGGCRLCVVEVKGKSAPLTACTLTVEEGMAIKTDTPRLRKLRKFTLQLILSEHPNACLVCERESDCANFQECIKKSAVTFGCKSCPQNDNCELQNMVRELNIKSIPFQFRYRNLEVERHDPFFDRDYNLCILCGRCIRMCEEIRHANTLQFHHRGPDTMVGTAFDLPHLESACQFCGACVDVCPTGALRDRFSRYDKPPEKSIKTTCMLCNLGCAIDLNIAGEKIICSTPHSNQICSRGRFGIAPLVHHPKRITKPLMKKGDGIIEVEWDEALHFVARKLIEHKNHTGILLSGQLTLEAIDRVSSLGDFLKAKLAAPLSMDHTIMPFDLNKIKGNAAVVIVNTDMIADYSVLLLKLRKKLQDNTSFIVINTVAHSSAQFADLVLKPDPGTEYRILKALAGNGNFPVNCGIASADIERARLLTKNRQLYVMYDSSNFATDKSGKYMNTFPLHKQTNTLKIAKMGFDRTYDEVLTDRTIDCLYLTGVAPRLHRKYKTIIVQDCFIPDFDFDVFLPAATFAETDGSMVDIEGKMKKLRRAIEPVGKTMPDGMIVDGIASALGIRLKKGPTHKKQKMKNRPTTQRTSKEYPLWLLVKENAYIYRNKTLSSVLKGFDRLRQDQCVWLNERTAKKHKLHDGAQANVISRQTSFSMPVKICQDVPDNTILIFAHPSLGNTMNQPVRLECIKS